MPEESITDHPSFDQLRVLDALARQRLNRIVQLEESNSIQQIMIEDLQAKLAEAQGETVH